MEKKEAMKILKDFHDKSALFSVRTALHTIIPELRESEDEKIRKDLITFLGDIWHLGKNANFDKWGKADCSAWIAWLEKQGEEKTVNYPIEGMYPYTDPADTLDGEIENIWNKLRNCDNTFTAAKSGFYEVIHHFVNWLEKQGEQPKEATYTNEVETGNGNIKAMVTEKVQLPKFKVKYAGNEYNVLEIKESAEATFYGIEDEPNHIDYVKAENCEIISGYAIKENGSPYPTKPAVFSEQKSQRMVSAEAKEALYDKPTDEEMKELLRTEYEKGRADAIAEMEKPTWSVEDMSKVQRICKYLDEAKKYYADITEVRECTNWLKSFKDRVQPQSKQEWSEEDVYNSKLILSTISQDQDLSLETKDKLTSWFKSLKPQNHWKPSDEQIIALRWVLNNVPYNKHKEEISGLLDQIKDL